MCNVQFSGETVDMGGRYGKMEHQRIRARKDLLAVIDTMIKGLGLIENTIPPAGQN